MGIPNAKKYRLKNPNGPGYATVVAVLPKKADVNAYVKDAAARFDCRPGKRRGPTRTKFASVNRSSANGNALSARLQPRLQVLQCPDRLLRYLRIRVVRQFLEVGHAVFVSADRDDVG